MPLPHPLLPRGHHLTHKPSALRQWLQDNNQTPEPLDLGAQLADAHVVARGLQRDLALARAQVSHTGPPRTHLVIGDAHSDPAAPNERFTWLGRVLVDLKPDVVVDIGDWATLGSLYHKDWGKMRGEGKRLSDDLAVAVEARALVDAELRAYNKGRRNPYRPALYSTLGNHEDRLVGTIERAPHLAGTLSLDALGHARYGWAVSPFLTPLALDGILYQHYWTAPGGRAVASEKHHAAQLLDKGLLSCVQGHSHRYDLSVRRRWDGRKAMALVAGCFFEHTEPWAGPDNDLWARGLVVLRDVQDGFGHAEFLGMGRIRDTYSDSGG